MTDDALIEYLVHASVGAMIPMDFNSYLALQALARRIVKLEQKLADIAEQNELWDGS